MVEAEQVDTAEINLGSLHESSLLHQASRQIVVDLHVAERQETTVTLPVGTGLVVVGIARSSETRELSIHVGVGGAPAAVVVLL